MPTFESPAPISMTIEIVGDVRITASDRTDTVVDVRPHDPSKASDVKAAQETRIEHAAGSLLVKTPKHWKRHTPFGGGESVDVTIEVPTGSTLDGISGFGDFHGEGELGRCDLKTAMGSIRLDHTGALSARTGYGDITVDRVAGDATITTGSGDVRIGVVDGSLTVRNSNGDSTLGEAKGEVRVKAANGDVTIDRAHTSVTARSANGSLRVGDARRGSIDLQTSVGQLEIGIHDGTAAWLDLTSKYGRVRSSLDTTDSPGGGDATVEVRARTSAGDIVIGRAAADDTPQP